MVSVVCPKAKIFSCSFEVLEDVHIYRTGYRWPAQALPGVQDVQTAHLVVTTNESHKRIALERRGMAPGDVPHRALWPGPRASHRLPALAWRNGKRLLVYLGEISRQDRVDHLIRVVRLLFDELGRAPAQDRPRRGREPASPRY
jgi:hypothetical protein